MICSLNSIPHATTRLLRRSAPRNDGGLTTTFMGKNAWRAEKFEIVGLSCGGPGIVDGNALIRSAMSTRSEKSSLKYKDPTILNFYARALTCEQRSENSASRTEARSLPEE